NFRKCLVYSREKVSEREQPSEVRLWDAETGKLVRTFTTQVLDGSSRCYALSPDGKTLATVGRDYCTILLWDMTSGKQVMALRGHSERITSLAFAPDNKTLASGSSEGVTAVPQLVRL